MNFRRPARRASALFRAPAFSRAPAPSRASLSLWALAFLWTAVAAGLSGCGEGRTPVVVYSPHGRDLLELLENAYEAKNPEIDVRWLDMGSQEVYDRIRFEKVNPQADVWFGGPDTIFTRGVEDGLLAAYRPSWADFVPLESQHPEDRFFGLYLACPILVYNSAAVSEEEAPRDWDDLLDPRWSERVLIRDPLASGTMRTVFGLILSRSVIETGDEGRGFEWLRRLDAQTREYTLNPALLFEKLQRQEGLVSIWELTDILLLQKRESSPLRYRFATSGTPVINDAIGLVEGAPHGEAARAFIEWVGSAEAQEMVARQVYRLPARTDLPAERLPEWAQKVLQEMSRAQVDWQMIADRGSDWMTTWDRTVRGQGTD